MKKICFVILTWNSASYIQNCLRSVLALTGFETEILVVDNGSSDGTVEKIKALGITPIALGENKGTTYSRNLAIKKRSGDADFVCVLDSDTQINQTAIELLCAALEENSGAAICGPYMENLSGQFQVSCKRFPTAAIKLLKGLPIKSANLKGEAKERYEISDFTKTYEVDYLISACWMIKAGAILKIGLLDEKIFYSPEDVDYCLRAHQAGFKVVYCPQAKIIHDTQRISKKKLVSKTNLSHVAGLCHYFKKHRYLFRAPTF